MRYIGLFFALCTSVSAMAQDAPKEPASAGPSQPTVAAPAPEQQLQNAPSRLAGRWYTPGRAYSNTWAIEKIDANKKTVLLSYYSTRQGCSFRNLPGQITSWDGTKFSVNIENVEKLNDCFKAFRVELRRVLPGKDEFSGTIFVMMTVSGYVPELETVVSP